MRRWIHHYATSTILASEEIREFAKFLGHSLATNDVMVHWLKPQTHMEWFPLKKSSIDGNQYLVFLWELGELPVYIYWWCWQFAAPYA